MEVVQVPVLSDNVAYLLIDKKTKVAAAVVRQTLKNRLIFQYFLLIFAMKGSSRTCKTYCCRQGAWC